jgi:hypothetical protein
MARRYRELDGIIIKDTREEYQFEVITEQGIQLCSTLAESETAAEAHIKTIFKLVNES